MQDDGPVAILASVTEDTAGAGPGTIEEALQNALTSLHAAATELGKAERLLGPPPSTSHAPGSDERRLEEAGFQRVGGNAGVLLVTRTKRPGGSAATGGDGAPPARRHDDDVRLLYEEIRDTYVRLVALRADVALTAASL